MTASLPRLCARLAAAVLCLALASCGYNNIPTLEEQAKAKWADVQNNYQRRADLIPNLVATVQGYAKQEKDVLTAVVEARAKATQTKIDVSQLTDPEKLKQFQDAQNQLYRRARPADRHQRELSRLKLKSNQNFLALQSQLEGTENRIACAPRLHRSGAGLQHRAENLPGPAVGGDLLPVEQADGGIRGQRRRAEAAASEVLSLRDPAAGPDGRSVPPSPSAARIDGASLGRTSACLALTLLALLSAAFAINFPALTGRIVDQANIIPADSRATIEPKLADLETKSGIQLVVATVTLARGPGDEPYASDLRQRAVRAWKLGEKTKNNGVLLLVAPNERRVRIEVGYGLEGTLTDALSQVIITNAIAPRFKTGDYGGGITRGVDDIITVLTTDASEWQQRAARCGSTGRPLRAYQLVRHRAQSSSCSA